MKTSTKILMALVSFVFFTSKVSLADDIGVDTITTPVSGSNIYGNYPFNLVFPIENYGSTTIAMSTVYDIAVSVSGGAPITQTISVSASWPAGGVYTVTLTGLTLPNGLPNGPYQIDIYTILTGDTVNSNDTGSVTLNYTSTAGIADVSKGSIGSVFYNEGQVNVNLTNTVGLTDFSVELYSLTGQIVGSLDVKNSNLPEVSIKIAAPNFASGIYVVAIREKNVLLSRKKIFIE